MEKRDKTERRKFLGTFLAGLGAVTALGRGKARVANGGSGRRDILYRRTPHVDSYYRTLKD